MEHLKIGLEAVDEEMASQNAIIADARARVRELSHEREEIARELEQAERQAAHEKCQEEGRIWREANPEEHEAFMEAARKRNQ